MEPNIIKGNCHCDERGSLFYNNDFDATKIKRIYIIENKNTDVIRGWQGHQKEQRWFSVISGKFKIELIQIDDWENPSKDLERYSFEIDSDTLNIIHIPPGYISSIQSLECNSKLLIMADYSLDGINDDFRYDKDYFNTY